MLVEGVGNDEGYRWAGESAKEGEGKRDWAEIEDNLAGSRACKEGGGWARGKCNPAAGKCCPTARKCIPSMRVEEKDRGDGKGNGNRREEREGG